MTISKLMARQREFYGTGKTLPVENRIEALKKLSKAILQNEEKINAALKADLGKSAFESYMCEVGLVVSEISYLIKHVKSFAKDRKVRTPLAQYAATSFQKPMPYGVTLIMSPWNYPFLLTMDPLRRETLLL